MTLTYPANTYGPSSVACTSGTYNVGVNFSGPSGTRTIGLSQGSTSLTPVTVDYLPGGFNSGYGFDGTVYAIAYDATRSQVYVGGSFNSYNNVPVKNLVRLNSDGSVDMGFVTPTGGFDNAVQTLAWDSVNQQLYVGGGFTTYTHGSTSTSQKYVTRLNSDGSVDLSFFPSGMGFSASVTAIVWDSTTQKLYVGGNFSVFTNGASIFQTFVSRLNSNGTVDTTFMPSGAGFDNPVYALALDPVTHQLYVGGCFMSFTNGATTAQNRLARVNSNGSLDTTFVPAAGGFNNAVNSISWDSVNQQLYVGGSFTTYTNGASTMQYFITRLKSNGTVDTTFIPAGGGFSGTIQTLLWDSAHSKLYTGGQFYSFSNGGSTAQTLISRLNSNGTVDTTFVGINSGTTNGSGYVYAFALDSANQKVLVGGSFINFLNGGVTTAQNRLMRLTLNGVVDPTFMSTIATTGFNSYPNALAWDSVLGKLYVGGTFTFFSNSTGPTVQNYLSRLNPDGTVDTNFIPASGGPDNAVSAIIQDTVHQKIYLGGSFTQYPQGGTIQNFAARVDYAGGLDTSFIPAGAGFNSSVAAIALDPATGKVYAGGNFTTYTNGVATTQNRLTRLNADGTVDTTFVSAGGGFDSGVFALAWDSANQKLYVAGNFTTYTHGGSTAQNYLTRLNADGTVDTTFVPAGGGMNSTVYALAFDSATGKLYVGGLFSAYTNGGSTVQMYISRLSSTGTVDTTFIPANGGFDSSVNALVWDASSQTLFAGGNFASFTHGATTTQGHIARLTASGVPAATFNSGNGFNSTVKALAWDAVHQKIYCGGSFGSYNGALVGGVARLTGDGSLDL